MEAYDIFRVLSLLAAWAIPAILLLAIVVFVVAAPALTLAGAVLRLYEVVRGKMLPAAGAKKQLETDVEKLLRQAPAGTANTGTTGRVADRELVGTKR